VCVCVCVCVITTSEREKGPKTVGRFNTAPYNMKVYGMFQPNPPF
jgi:hypothetical protein